MSMRLIDADALLESGICAEYGYNDNGLLLIPMRDVTNSIRNAPTIDAEPVRHGRWKCNKPCPVCGGDRFEGLDADIWADWEPPYCPNCGAKMDGGADIKASFGDAPEDVGYQLIKE